MLAKGKGVLCEEESEGSQPQSPEPTYRNRIQGIFEADELAGQSEVQYYPSLVVYMRRLHGMKVTVLTRGGLAVAGIICSKPRSDTWLNRKKSA